MTSKVSTETVSPQKTIGDNLNYSFNYVYDENYAHRLVSVGDRHYTYDSNGNIIEEKEGEFMEGSESYHKITQEADDTYSTDYGWGLYKDDDNSSAKSSKYRRTYTWNEKNQLISSVDSTYSTAYVYGQDGQRSNKYTQNSETLYFNKMWTLHTDSGNSVYGGQSAKNIYLGETRIVTKLNGGNSPTYQEEYYKQYFYHSDHLGSASLISDYNGDEYQRIEYTPYGETWVEKTQNTGMEFLPYKFTGKEMDEETGLYYYGARYLDPKYSRWLSTDPALGEYIPQAPINDEARRNNANLPGMGGVFCHINCNLYHYSANNPVKYTDPDGKSVRGVLKLIEKHREQIKFAAEIFEVDPVGIASVIFQEKYYGVFADLKDIAAFAIDRGVNDKSPSTRSYGLAEMQLTLVCEIWGIDKNLSGANEEAYKLLQDDALSIAFIAAYISKNENTIGKKLKGSDAAGAHNMGGNNYKKVLDGTMSKSDVAKRSEPYQKAIEDALNGKIDTRRDDER